MNIILKFFSQTFPHAVSLNWLALFLSNGGFPIKAFDYPAPAMGNDWPPVGDWKWFLLNLVIWTVVAGVVVKLLGEKFNARVRAGMVVAAAAKTLVGIFYIVLKFD